MQEHSEFRDEVMGQPTVLNVQKKQRVWKCCKLINRYLRTHEKRRVLRRKPTLSCNQRRIQVSHSGLRRNWDEEMHMEFERKEQET